jgi:hypothetical protein
MKRSWWISGSKEPADSVAQVAVYTPELEMDNWLESGETLKL